MNSTSAASTSAGGTVLGVLQARNRNGSENTIPHIDVDEPFVDISLDSRTPVRTRSAAALGSNSKKSASLPRDDTRLYKLRPPKKIVSRSQSKCDKKRLGLFGGNRRRRRFNRTATSAFHPEKSPNAREREESSHRKCVANNVATSADHNGGIVPRLTAQIEMYSPPSEVKEDVPSTSDDMCPRHTHDNAHTQENSSDDFTSNVDAHAHDVLHNMAPPPQGGNSQVSSQCTNATRARISHSENNSANSQRTRISEIIRRSIREFRATKSKGKIPLKKAARGIELHAARGPLSRMFHRSKLPSRKSKISSRTQKLTQVPTESPPQSSVDSPREDAVFISARTACTPPRKEQCDEYQSSLINNVDTQHYDSKISDISMRANGTYEYPLPYDTDTDCGSIDPHSMQMVPRARHFDFMHGLHPAQGDYPAAWEPTHRDTHGNKY